MWTDMSALANTQPPLEMMVILAFMVFLMTRLKPQR